MNSTVKWSNDEGGVGGVEGVWWRQGQRRNVTLADGKCMKREDDGPFGCIRPSEWVGGPMKEVAVWN